MAITRRNVVPILLGTMCVSLALPSVVTPQTIDQLIPHRVKLESVEYQGARAIKVSEDGEVPNGEAYAEVKGAAFHNGTIEIQVAGRPAAGVSAGARGFIGVAFHLRDGRFEYIYLRPTNGRADDQVRRNHSTQYSSHPDFDFARLRKESPEKYESYVDLEPGVWTRIRITVEGTTARLFVHGAAQPALVVTDLKLGDSSGGVALWIGPGTEGYFTGLAIRPAPAPAAAAIDRAPLESGRSRVTPRATRQPDRTSSPGAPLARDPRELKDLAAVGSVVSQRGHRIYSSGTPRGDAARRERHERQQADHSSHGDWIMRADAE